MVSVGIWLENKSDKVWFSSLKDLICSKNAKKLGERLVLWGVVLETVVAGTMLGKEFWESDLINKRIAAQNPYNFPIESVSVNQVRIEIFGEDSDDPRERSSELVFGHFGGNRTNMSQMFLPGVVSFRVTQLQHGRNREYRMDFNSSVFQKFPINPLTPNEVNAVSVSIPIQFGRPAIIVEGEITLIVNSAIKIRFPIPPQTNRFPVASSFRTNGVFVPIPEGQGWHF
jgi:hypothetical protein